MTTRQPDPLPGAEAERGFAVAVFPQGVDEAEELAELRELARTAGVETIGELIQHRGAGPTLEPMWGKGSSKS